MRRTALFGVTALGLVALLAPLNLTSPASAAPPEPDQIPVTYVDEEVPADLTLATEVPEDAVSLVPAATRDAVVALQLGEHSDQVTQFAWDEDNQTLELHVHGDPAPVLDVVSAYAPDQRTATHEAARSASELQQAVDEILEGRSPLPASIDVHTAWAEPDGSLITVGVDPATMVAARGEWRVNGITVSLEEADEPEPATRIRNTGSVYSGGLMNGQGFICTTGFPIRRNADAEPGMLSADHCGTAVEENWYWGSQQQVRVGFTTGQYPNGTDHEVWRNTQNPSVLMMVGTSTMSNTVVPLRGYYTAIVGDQVCYNGSRSGLVCGNRVERTGYAVCYAGLQCYSQLTVTINDAGTPAAGNGDSGGPVAVIAQAGDGSLGGYGAGIISGMINPSDNCTGDPAGNGRQCGTWLLYAPVAAFASGNTVFSLLAAPTP